MKKSLSVEALKQEATFWEQMKEAAADSSVSACLK